MQTRIPHLVLLLAMTMFCGEARADTEHDRQSWHGPVRDPGGIEDVDDERDCGENVEHPVGEDGPDDRGPGTGTAAHAAGQDDDTGDLSDPAGERGVPEQADGECGEDRAPAR